MADRDRIIRVILDGRDRLSSVVSKAADSIQNDLDLIQGAFSDLEKGTQEFDKSIKRTFTDVEKGSSGLDVARKRVDGLTKSIRNFRAEANKRSNAQKILSTEGILPEKRASFLRSFNEGAESSRTFRDQVNKQVQATKEIFQSTKNNLRLEEQERKRILREELFQQEENDRERIAKLRTLRREEDSDLVKQDLDRRIRAIRFEMNERKKLATENLANEFAERKRRLIAPDSNEIVKQAIEARREWERTGTTIERIGRRAGSSFGDFTRSIGDARRGAREFRVDGQRVETVAARIGFAFGRASRSIGNFINLRWTFITGVISVFFNVVTLLASALVALASSASLAAIALGGSLLGAITQLVPVVGILAASFQRFNVVMEAVTEAEKLRTRSSRDAKDAADRQREATQSLTDAQWTLKTALEAVTDAQWSFGEAQERARIALSEQIDAAKRLAEARKQAQRDIVDANLEERDSALALREAELDVLDAKEKLRKEEERQRRSKSDISSAQAALREAQQRLQIAQQQGDQAEISAATHQVSIAKQNLNAIEDQASEAENKIKELQTQVKRAELNKESATIRSSRAQEDAKEARDKGVEGSDIVIQAQKDLKAAIEGVADAQRDVVLANRAIRDSLHAVAIARREEADSRREMADATNTQTEAQKALQEKLADLTPSEKKLFKSLQRIKAIYKKVFVGDNKRDGILGVITEAFSRAVDNAATLLQDPRIQRAAQTLANSIAEAIDTISEFTLSPEFKEALIFFAEEAAKNIPKITQAFLNLLKAFLRIGKEGAPIFEDLLDRFVGLTENIEKFTANEEKMDKLFGTARKHLDSWIELAKSIGRVVFYLFRPAQTSGQGLVDQLTALFNRIGDFLRDNPEKVSKFFENVSKNIEGLAIVLGRVLPILFQAFTSDEFSAFTRVVVEVLIPGLTAFVVVLGKLSQALVFLLDLPVVGQLVKWALEFAIIERSFNKLFPITQKLTVLVRRGLVGGFKTMFDVMKNGKQGLKAVSLLFDDIRLRAMYAKDALVQVGKNMKNAALSAIELGKRAAIAAKEGLVALAQNARATAIAVGTRLLGALKAAALFMRIQLIKAIALLKLSIRALIGATGIGLLILAAGLIIEHWDKVKVALRVLFEFFKRIWGKIGGFVIEAKNIILKTLKLLFDVTLIGIIWRFRDKIIGAFNFIKNGIIGAFQAAITWVKQKITGLADWVGEKIRSIPIIGGLFGKNEASKKDTNKVFNSVLRDESMNKNRKEIKSLRESGLSPEEILDQLIASGSIDQKTLAKLIKKYGGQLLDTGGLVGVGSGLGQAVPIVAHAGEWVLNRQQQGKLASRLGASVGQVAAYLFGTNVGANLPGKRAKGKTPSYFNDFTLIPQEDDAGQTVWFIKLADGTYGQVTGRDAKKIQNSRGNWIPEYVKRNSHGFAQSIMSGYLRPGQFALGGIVSPGVQRFAQGGVVQNPGFGNTVARRGNTINQTFSITTQGDSDYNYIMRLGAIHAQESF